MEGKKCLQNSGVFTIHLVRTKKKLKRICETRFEMFTTAVMALYSNSKALAAIWRSVATFDLTQF